MKRFLKRLFIYIGILLVFNIVISNIIKNINPSPTYKQFYKLSHLDVVFTGSSHSAFSINPFIIDSIVGVKTFNLSSPAQSPKTAYFVVNEIIKEKHPDLIVQELFFYTFYPQNQFLNQMLPISEFKHLDSQLFIDHFSYIELTKMAFPFYYQKKNIKNFFKTLPYKSEDNKEDVYYHKGYYGFNNRVSKKELEDAIVDYKSFDRKLLKKPTEQIEYLIKTIDLCRKNNVKLIWYTAPLPKAIIDKMETYKEFSFNIDSIASANSLKYIDLNNFNELFSDSLHFKDSDHLNYNGGLILSDFMANEILKNE